MRDILDWIHGNRKETAKIRSCFPGRNSAGIFGRSPGGRLVEAGPRHPAGCQPQAFHGNFIILPRQFPSRKAGWLHHRDAIRLASFQRNRYLNCRGQKQHPIRANGVPWFRGEAKRIRNERPSPRDPVQLGEVLDSLRENGTTRRCCDENGMIRRRLRGGGQSAAGKQGKGHGVRRGFFMGGGKLTRSRRSSNDCNLERPLG